MRCTRLVAVALTLAGCAELTISTRTAPGAQLAQYHTYAWADDAAARTPAEQAVRAALQRDLAARGITPATDAPPDFYVAYRGGKEEKSDLTRRGGNRWWGMQDVVTRTEGTLVVDFVDAKTQQTFWHGTASTVLDHPDKPDVGKIDKAVADLVGKYPVPAVASTARPAL